MATTDQVSALLSIPCDWCRAAAGEPCYTTVGRGNRAHRVPVTTLDGGSHEARWRKALGTDAVVLAAAVAETQGHDDTPGEPALVGAISRPW